MAVRVIDASALAAVVFVEAEADVVVERLGDARLVAPALLDFELANVCLTKMRRHPELREPLMAAFAMRARLALEIVAIDPDEVLKMAESTGLTAYDASYLWLSQQLGAELVTLDRQLAKAAAILHS